LGKYVVAPPMLYEAIRNAQPDNANIAHARLGQRFEDRRTETSGKRRILARYDQARSRRILRQYARI
jgi:hypothetical protein